MTEEAPGFVPSPREEEGGVPIQWVASWGEDLKEGDLIRVKQLGGPARVTSLRKFVPPGPREQGPVQIDEHDRWYYGVILEDRTGSQFHLYVQRHEAVYVAIEVPPTLPDRMTR